VTTVLAGSSDMSQNVPEALLLSWGCEPPKSVDGDAW